MFTSFGSICIITLSGELRVAVEFVSAQPDILILVPLYSLSGYMSMACILAMVRLFGATDTEIVKSLRKVCQQPELARNLSLFTQDTMQQNIFYRLVVKHMSCMYA